MRWEYIRNDKQYYADWSPNGFRSDDHVMNLMVQNLVDSKTIVACGVVGPNLPASVVDEVRAWGTVMTVIADMPNATVLGAPDCPVVPEKGLLDGIAEQ